MLNNNEEIKPKIGFIGLDRQNILDELNFAIKNEFDCYEIQAVKEPDEENPRSEIINQAREIARKNNIYLTLHASYFLHLCSLIPGNSETALKFAKNEIILAQKIGVRQVTVHAGHFDSPISKTTIAKNFEVVIENLKELVKLGNYYGVKIGLENAPRNSHLYLTEGSPIDSRLATMPKDLLRIVDSVEGLKVVFDIGHANTTGLDLVKYLKKVKDFIVNIHIHDNRGVDEHALIGEGNIDFKNFLKECKKSNYYGPFILEVFPYKNILKGKERFLNIWNQI